MTTGDTKRRTRSRSGPALFVLTLAWLGGTVGLFVAAVDRVFCACYSGGDCDCAGA
jgi:hypothetical protein